ncbi:PBSX family phage terminase large subunit [Shinella sp. JR1-6]|uniref:PBSX family phage terminase large subunit n=1 Tax=Shinella sp. JR1-6 TaxID=2527671 RepID=UPI00102D4945|nr:PBSX family phage terminase large subunit [Shinella sp. JR1-6]TAA50993.1 PBSX family phage terminase large subunit [Shinella sp. JR1-6]
MSTLRIEVPRKLKPLLQPKRYKGAYGGRGGAKSHFFAEQIAVRAATSPIRAVCIREVQNSIKDSVRQLIVDKILKHGLEGMLEILEAEIRGRVGTPAEGSLIVFKGMQSYNAANIKSLEGFDIAWVEEAQTFSQASLDMLRPTLRKPGSELWFSWNPRYKTDPVDQFFRQRPPKDSVAVNINWQDNPWFRDTPLHQDMLDDYEADADKAEHVWGGAYGASQGAILARWVNEAERAGRITNEVDYDPNGAPVEISSDLGYRDTSCWWFWQRRLGGYVIFDYMHGTQMDADDWAPLLQARLKERGVKPEMLGRIWLPPDAKAKTFATKHSAMEKFIRAFGVQKIGPKPGSKKDDQISAARTIIKKVKIHKDRCEDGIDGLLAWEYEWNEEDNIFSREPKHNWASHRGDSFAYGCEIMEGLVAPPQPERGRHLEVGHGNTMKFDDMWATQQAASGRI